MDSQARRMRFDLHVHTRRSFDSLSHPAKVMDRARSAGLDGIAVTDHDTSVGAREAAPHARQHGLIFVPGIEVKTDVEDVLALFVEEDVPRRGFGEALDTIHSLGGVAVLAHPRRHGCVGTVDHARRVDLVEGHNARYAWNRGYTANAAAVELARAAGRPLSAGSDAHTVVEVGRAAAVVGECADTEELRRRLLAGDARVEGMASSPGRELLGQVVKGFKLRRPASVAAACGRALVVASLKLTGGIRKVDGYENAVRRFQGRLKGA